MHPSVKKYIAQNGPLNEELVDLLTSMLSADLQKRPESVEQVLSHPYFTQSETADSEVLMEEFKALVGDRE